MASPVPTAATGNAYIDGILTSDHWADGAPGPSTRLGFTVVGDDGRTEPFRFGLDDVSGLTDAAEEAAFKLAMRLVSEVCGLSFTEVSTQEAADVLVGAGPAPGAEGALGFATTPGGEATGVKLNSDNLASADGSTLRQGGYDFTTVLHETGHALGLSHPFDDDPFPAFPGVGGPGDLGDNGLGQGVYTVMSYDDGFPERDGPGDTSVNQGWSGTPMAFDIAALQRLYGANASHRAGDDTYVLPVDGGSGEFYSCIWDAGGRDRIIAGSDRGHVIDLRPATLLNEPGGGGWLSAQPGVRGGFTIAAGVVIENGQGRGGNDTIIGNGWGNGLVGNGGGDWLRGLGGRDVLNGGEGADRLTGGSGADLLIGGAGGDRFVFNLLTDAGAAVVDRIDDFDRRHDLIELQALDDLIDGSLRFVGGAAFSGAAGGVRAVADAAANLTRISIDTDGDSGAEFRIDLAGRHALTAADFIL